MLKEKDLCKLIEKKSLLHIMQHIHVVDGVATVTDLELSCSIPVDLPDGMYDGAAWKTGRYIPTDFKTEDFPEIPVRSGERRYTLYTEKLTGIPEILSPEIKFNLGGALFVFDGDKQCAVATDGHRLYCVGNPIKPDENNSFLLSRKAIEFLMQYPAWDVHRDKQNLFFETDTVKFSCRIIDQKFPNYQSVIPDWTQYSLIGDEKLINSIASFHAELKKMGVKSRNSGTFIECKAGEKITIMRPCEKGKAYRCHYDGTSSIDISIAVNSEFVKDIASIPGPKKVYYKSSENTFLTFTEHGQYLIMRLYFDESPIDDNTEFIDIEVKTKHNAAKKQAAKLPSKPDRTQELLDRIAELEAENKRLKSLTVTVQEVQIIANDFKLQYADHFIKTDREEVFRYQYGAPSKMVPWLKDNGFSWNYARRVWVKPCL